MNTTEVKVYKFDELRPSVQVDVALKYFEPSDEKSNRYYQWVKEGTILRRTSPHIIEYIGNLWLQEHKEQIINKFKYSEFFMDCFGQYHLFIKAF